MKKTILAFSIVVAGLSNSALAADTVLSFYGACDNDKCKSYGVDGSAPASAVASITLTDLAWVAQGNSFVASFSAVKDFSYSGPQQHVAANSSGVELAGTGFSSSSASVAGINSFEISYADGAGFFAGDDTGWGLGFTSL